jgi:hypothetical protein
MDSQLPFAAACERNKQPILDVLSRVLPAGGRILEIGSATGQHVVHFAPRLPAWDWQPSDQVEYLEGLRARIRREGAANISEPLELDVLGRWPAGLFDAVFSSNTAHIMHWEAVVAMFRGVGESLVTGGLFCLYGPFNQGGEFTSPSNAEFDADLKSRDPGMGLRDIEALESLALEHHMQWTGRHVMPANNQLLVFSKSDR